MSLFIRGALVLAAVLGGLAPMLYLQTTAGPALKLPAELHAKLGEPVRIQATTNCSAIRWTLGAGLIEVLPAMKGANEIIVSATKEGKYIVSAIGTRGQAFSSEEHTTVTFGQAPPGPGPDPGPQPKPNPPAPTDPLVAKLQAAYTADPAMPAVKLGQKVMLIGLYEGMALKVLDPTLQTSKDLSDAYVNLAKKTIASFALVDLRKIIAAEVAAMIGTDPGAKLDPVLRPKAAALFDGFGKALMQVK